MLVVSPGSRSTVEIPRYLLIATVSEESTTASISNCLASPAGTSTVMLAISLPQVVCCVHIEAEIRWSFYTRALRKSLYVDPQKSFGRRQAMVFSLHPTLAIFALRACFVIESGRCDYQRSQASEKVRRNEMKYIEVHLARKR